MRLNRNLIIFIAIGIAAIALFAYFTPAAKKPEEIPLTEAIAMSQSGEIAQITEENDALLITTIDGTELKTIKGNLTLLELEELGFVRPEGGYEIKSSGGFNWSMMINFLPLIIFGGLLFFLFRRAQGANTQAMNFGRSRARLFPAHTPTVTFDDVAGVEEAKQE